MANDWNKECLEAHNKYRELHQANDLEYASDLAKSAQAWADKLADMGALQHSPNSAGKFGENVAMKFMSGTYVYTAQQATDQWYSEIEMYDFNQENQTNCGHFSQVVWKGSEEAGFGKAQAKDGKTFVVGQYRPPGNFMNRWKENVLPPKDGKIVVPSRDDIMGRGDGKDAPQRKLVDGKLEGGGSGGKSPDDVMVSRSSKTKVVNGEKTVTTVETYQKPNGQKYEVTKTKTSSGDAEEPVTKSPARMAKSNAPAKKHDPSTFEKELLDAHNKYRGKHGAEPLTINSELCELAQEWADYMTQHGKFEHSTHTYNSERIGENIAAKWSSGEIQYPGSEVADQWYSEEPKYEYGTNPTVLNAGHFTQVVWKGSKEMGIGRSQDKSGKVIVVCNYFPAGNIVGKFPQNIDKPKK